MKKALKFRYLAALDKSILEFIRGLCANAMGTEISCTSPYIKGRPTSFSSNLKKIDLLTLS